MWVGLAVSVQLQNWDGKAVADSILGVANLVIQRDLHKYVVYNKYVVYMRDVWTGTQGGTDRGCKGHRS